MLGVTKSIPSAVLGVYPFSKSVSLILGVTKTIPSAVLSVLLSIGNATWFLDNKKTDVISATTSRTRSGVDSATTHSSEKKQQ